MTTNWVVRAGIANWQDLVRAYQLDQNVAGVFGFSVQYAPDLPWEDLARAGQFPHPKICYANREDLEQAVSSQGYVLVLIATPGRGYHHEFSLNLMQN